MSSVFRFPYRGRREPAVAVDEILDDGPADGEEQDDVAESKPQRPSETRLKTTETNGSKPNRERSKKTPPGLLTQNGSGQGKGSKRGPRPVAQGRGGKGGAPRERIIVNGLKPENGPPEQVPSNRGSDNRSGNRSGQSSDNDHEDLAADSATDDRSTEKVVQRVGELEERVERLSVICEAMWQLLSDEAGLSLDQLSVRVEEMIAAQAQPDVEPELPEPESICPTCGETMPVGATTCLFCSARSNSTRS
ncbi:MAG: hypothetical protein ACRBK7_05330 [Acidimicrobiales bacterium]